VTRPDVSVLLPVRNAGSWLEPALDSLWRQTFASFEVIALEDGSTDGSEAVLSRQRDPRLRVIPTGGVGMATALNRGLAEARGALVARQDADDLSHPDRLRRQAAFLACRRDVDVLATTADYIGPHGEPVANAWVHAVRAGHDPAVTPDDLASRLPVTCCITHGSVMARTAVLRAAGGYRPEFWPADDYDLWLRLLPRHRFAKLPARLYTYRVHPAQHGEGAKARQTGSAIRAKLEWLRRAEPWLPADARIATVGTPRGNAWYRESARLAGLVSVNVDDSWNVLAVSDFTRLPESLAAHRARYGGRVRANFIVREEVPRRQVLGRDASWHAREPR
jgi:glycosyltransferase involved in cell wall biosynthesis